jgi:uncharacterized protein (TIGR02271 family)
MSENETRRFEPVPREAEVVRSEEGVAVDREAEHTGSVRAHKTVGAEAVVQDVPRDVEYADLERQAPAEGDSGEIEELPDGSVSIPIFEEELVVTKRLVVKERVIVRKRTVTEQHRIEAELKRERVEIETDESVAEFVENDAGD